MTSNCFCSFSLSFVATFHIFLDSNHHLHNHHEKFLIRNKISPLTLSIFPSIFSYDHSMALWMFIVMSFLRIWKIHANFLICYPPISLPYAMYIKRKKYFLSLATHIYKMMWKEIKFAFFLFLNSILTLNSIVLIQKVSFSIHSTKGELFFIIFNEGDAHTAQQSEKCPTAIYLDLRVILKSTHNSINRCRVKKIWNAVERSTVKFPRS